MKREKRQLLETAVMVCYDCGRRVTWAQGDAARRYLTLCNEHYTYRVLRHLPLTRADADGPIETLDAEIAAADRGHVVHWRPPYWMQTACGISISRRPGIATAPRVTAASCGRCQRADILMAF